MDEGYEGRVVVVTGGTGGLGRAVVDRLLDAGASLVIPVYDIRELEGFDPAEDPRVTIVREVDLGDESAVESFYDQGLQGRPLWASVHIAGGFAMGPVADSGQTVFDRMMAMNARTAYLCCRESAKRMRQTDAGGRLVNVSALAALQADGGENMAAYLASKAAVAALTRALSAEFKADGIWVNAVAPSIIDTPANRSAKPNADHAAWPKPAEIAETICFLASPENRVTRGGIVPVCGRC